MRLLLSATSAILFATVTPAMAQLPEFSAACPNDQNLLGKSDGTVQVNGVRARVEKFNDEYYEARAGDVVFSIAIDDGSLIVSYTGPGRLNGVCTVGEQTASMPSSPVVSGDQRVQFDPGTSGTVMSATLEPGTSVTYLLGAREGQFLRVDVQSLGGAIDYRILNPDGSDLLGLIGSDTPYEGQLWQSGDHAVEIVNAGSRPVSFDIGIGIE